MVKQSGLGDQFVYGGYLLSGDIQSLSNIHGGPAPWEVTGIDKSAMERIGLLRDGGFEATAFFNDATNQAHSRFKTLPTTDVLATYLRGSTLGGSSANCVAKQIGYDGNRAASGELTLTVETQANGFGIEWTTQMTAGMRSDSTATNGTAVDFSAASAFGLQAYLQVTAFTGTSVTIKLQESSDNAGDAYADVVGGGFTLVNSITSERIATSGVLAVERYLRVITTGTFSAVTFCVGVARNLTATAF